MRSVTIVAPGYNYTNPTVTFVGGSGSGATATATVSNGHVISVTVTNGGTGYQTAPVITFIGGGGTGATAESTVEIDIDKADSFGDNNKFKEQSQGVINFDESNPFGEINNA